MNLFKGNGRDSLPPFSAFYYSKPAASYLSLCLLCCFYSLLPTSVPCSHSENKNKQLKTHLHGKTKPSLFNRYKQL